ncbi:MAG: hypothetical protein JXR77_18460 [Lentisphaeria bacterium]|nr:hypothetical protein [Lentisphaeria bacterium]
MKPAPRHGWVALFLAVSVATAADSASCRFAAGAWQARDWIMVKSPRWAHMGDWVQEKDHIANRTPADASADSMLGDRAPECYTSMVLARRFSGNLSLKATLAFEHRMAPLLVLAADLGHDEQGRPEYREHTEFVLYDRGVNVWRHEWTDGKPAWRKLAYWNLAVEPGKRHTFEVRIDRSARGDLVSISVDGQEVGGYRDGNLPAECHAGITGCEGVNRFYDFQVISQ